MVKRLTDRQQDVLAFIQEHIERNGYPPTLQEIADFFGISSLNAVRDHLRALEEKGHLRRVADKSRAMVLVKESAGLPLIGEVAAGTPIMAEENRQEVIDLDRYFGSDPRTFVLRVSGDSMVGAGIRHGDLVVVHHQPTLESGDIGVVYLGEDATVKRIFIEAGHVRLQPENADMSPVVVSRDDPEFRIGGKVIGVIRKL